jgi:hypothetical protein
VQSPASHIFDASQADALAGDAELEEAAEAVATKLVGAAELAALEIG